MVWYGVGQTSEFIRWKITRLSGIGSHDGTAVGGGEEGVVVVVER